MLLFIFYLCYKNGEFFSKSVLFTPSLLKPIAVSKDILFVQMSVFSKVLLQDRILIIHRLYTGLNKVLGTILLLVRVFMRNQRYKGKTPILENYANCVLTLVKSVNKRLIFSLFPRTAIEAWSASRRLRFIIVLAQVSRFDAVTPDRDESLYFMSLGGMKWKYYRIQYG